MRKINKKAAAAAVVAAATVAGAGVGYAYWTTTGAGGGNSTTSAGPATNAVTETATFDASTLAPGQSTSVTYTAANSSDTDLQVATPVATISTDKTYVNASSVSKDCADFLTLNPSTLHGGVVPAHATSTSFGGATLNFANSSLNQDSCKGMKITISLQSS